MVAYFGGLREDLFGEGGDPLGTPQQRADLDARNSRASARVSGSVFLLIVLIVLVAVLWQVWT